MRVRKCPDLKLLRIASYALGLLTFVGVLLVLVAEPQARQLPMGWYFALCTLNALALIGQWLKGYLYFASYVGVSWHDLFIVHFQKGPGYCFWATICVSAIGVVASVFAVNTLANPLFVIVLAIGAMSVLLIYIVVTFWAMQQIKRELAAKSG